MISKQSLGLGELIAVGCTAPIRPTAIIEGLNQESVGSFVYTDNFREEIMQTTQANTHTVNMGVYSDKLAEVIRNAMYDIRDYGIPFANCLDKKIEYRLSPESISDIATQGIYIRYFMLDNPFFSSPLYPTAVADKSQTYESVNLDMLNQLKWNPPTNEDLMKFIGTAHPDITAVMEDNDSYLDNTPYVMANLSSLGEMFERQGGVFNFRKVKCYDVNAVLRMYILLTKMYATEDPVPWLTGGDLTTYRRYVNLLWNGVVANLLVLKDLFQIYQGRKLVINAESAPAIVSLPGLPEGIKVLKAGYQVLYTNDFMNTLDQVGVSINDVVTGYGVARATNRDINVSDIIANPTLASDLTKDYVFGVKTIMAQNSKSIFMESGLKAIGEFLSTTPVVAERFKEKMGATTDLPTTWIADRFNKSLETAFHYFSDRSGDDNLVYNGEDRPFFEALLRTPLVSDFLKAMGCDLASEIVDLTFIEKAAEDNIYDKRQRLHVALINLIVKKCIQG